jgi:chromate transport protein ChrA
MHFTLTEFFGGLAIALAALRLAAHWRTLRTQVSQPATPLCPMLAVLACVATLAYASRIQADRILLTAAWVNLVSAALACAHLTRPIDALTRCRVVSNLAALGRTRLRRCSKEQRDAS